MTSCLNFSLVKFLDRKLQKGFEAAGLENRMIDVGEGTTISCWLPKNFSTLEEKLSDGDGSVAPEKPVLVLIHGFGLSSTWQWGHQIKALGQHFTLVIPDLVFFGLSTTTSPHRSEAFQAECVWLVLASLGIEKFSVVGTSYGGFVAYRLTQAHEDSVEKLVLSNSSILLTPEGNRELCKRGNAATIPELLLPQTREQLNRVGILVLNKPGAPWYMPNFLVNDMIEKLYKPNRTEKIHLLKGLVIGSEAGPAHMTKVDKDVLIIWGENDNVFLVEDAERIQNYLGKERAQLVVLKNAGHASQLEQPDQWNSVLLNFLMGGEY